MLEAIVDFDEFDVTPMEPNKIGVHERVVRCKDCMWHSFVLDDEDCKEYEMCAAWVEETVPDGFCHHGKRKAVD